MSNTFKRTTSINKILAMSKRKKVIQGGSSAGKTIAILAILIDKAIKQPMLEITVVGATVPHLKGGAMKDFLKIMKQTNRYKSDNWNITNSKYTFTNGAVIEFVNADGDKAIGPRRDILYINEANLIDFNTYTQLEMRTSQDIYLDFNPVNKFWAHTEILTEPDAEMIILTYRDNEGIPENTLEDLLSKRKKAETSEYWKNWCKVYLDGQIGALEGVIFQNWQVIDSIPKEAKLIGYGMDFGFTNDPTTLIAVYKYNKQLILDELIYKKGLVNSEIAALIKQHNANRGPIYADSSEPKSIKDIQGYGIGIFPVTKGPNSVKEGIQLMQEYEFLVTKGSVHLQEELMRYEWLKKGDVNTPADAWNHTIDAVRYCVTMLLGSRTIGVAKPFTMEYD